LNERKAGYQAGLMNAGGFLQGKVVGILSAGEMVVLKKMNPESDYLIMAISKEDIAKLVSGELP